MLQFFNSGLQLRIVSGEDQGQVFPITYTEVVLGRKMLPEEEKEGWILFADPTVSRMHAMLEYNRYINTYSLVHRSRTNPTQVNGDGILRQLLVPGDKLRIGNLEMYYELSDRSHTPKKAKSHKITSGLKLLVIEGSNRGESYPLTLDIVLIGRRKEGEETVPGKIILDDPKLHLEHGYFLWNERRKNYELFRHPKAIKLMSLKRFILKDHPPLETEIKDREPLKPEDLIRLGDSTLMLMREEIFVETGKSEVDPKIDTRVKPKKSRLILPRLPSSSPAAETPGPAVSSGAPAEPPPLEEFSGEQTAAWVQSGSYLLEVVEGKDRGTQYSVLKDALSEGRIISLGKRGKRENEIEISDPSIASEQANLDYSGGDLYLVAESPHFITYLNGAPMPVQEPVRLKSGDMIQMGETVLEFIDRQAKGIIGGFELKVVEGIEVDKNNSFSLERVNLVGRGAECRIRLSDKEVSRVHLGLRFKEGKFFIEHKSSLNPTYVNGISLPRGKERPLTPDDQIRLSRNTLLKFLQKT